MAEAHRGPAQQPGQPPNERPFAGDEAADSLEAQLNGVATRAGKLLQRIQESAQRGRGLIGSITELATLEAKLAALSLMEMQGMALAIALLAFSTWALLLTMVVMALVQWTPLGWFGALLLAALANAAAAVLIWKRMRQLTVNLSFDATRALLFPPPSTQEPRDDQHSTTAS